MTIGTLSSVASRTGLVAIGLASGVGAALGQAGPALADAGHVSSTVSTGALQAASRPAAPRTLSDPSAACPGTPTSFTNVRSADITTAGGTAVGTVYLQYNSTYRCVRAKVVGPLPSDDRWVAVVHKASTNQNTSTVTGSFGEETVYSDWVTDANIQQSAIGFKSNIQEGFVAAGGTGAF
jgi:hypothetical protein